MEHASPAAGATARRPGPEMESMTWVEVRQAVAEGFIPCLVVGSTEQHGPHLPLSTDIVIPCELVRRLADRADVLLAPPLRFGFKSKARSGGGQTFPGTISLDGTTLVAVVRDVVGELARHGFRHVVVLNWHSENTNFVWEGIDQARQLGRLHETIVLSIDSLSGSFAVEELAWLFPAGLPDWDLEHASMVETSLMMALRPELVREESIRDDAATEHPWYDLIPEPPRHVPASGVLANPSHASAVIGHRLADMMLQRLTAAIAREFGASVAPDRPLRTNLVRDLIPPTSPA